MVTEIYWGSGSPNSWRVLLAAEVLGVPYESKLLEFSKGQTRTPEHLALNPRGKVPVLRDGDVVLSESLAIVEYLDATKGGSLYGMNPREAAIVRRLICEFECYLREPISKVSSHLFTIGGVPPTPRTPTTEQAVAAAETTRQELASLSRVLTDKPWLAGERLSAADIAVFPFARLLLRAISKAEPRATELELAPFAVQFPGLARWVERVEGLPGYSRTYPPHWK
jgi:glutathione S-transferase